MKEQITLMVGNAIRGQTTTATSETNSDAVFLGQDWPDGSHNEIYLTYEQLAYLIDWLHCIDAIHTSPRYTPEQYNCKLNREKKA